MNLACNSGTLTPCRGTVSRVLIFDSCHLVIAWVCERHEVSPGVAHRIYRHIWGEPVPLAYHLEWP